MILTPTDRAMLALLTDAPQGPGYLGTRLWPSGRRTTAAYARPAGKTLNRLKAMGLARYIVAPDGRSGGWVRV